MSVWGVSLLALLAGSLIALATWAASVVRRDVSIVDSVWSVMVWVAGVAYAWTSPRMSDRGWVALGLITVWAVRLSVYITARNRGEPEDRRYRKIRENNQPHFVLKSLYIVFLLQAVLAWIVSLPLLASARSPAPLRPLDLFGAAVAVFGIGFETIADRQMSRFKARPGSRGRVLSEGLWRYSRHPNYFGECCVWWGIGAIALSTGAWWTLVSPVLMTVLLLRVSGVSLLERDIGERRPEYRDYVRQTSAFIPWRPARGAQRSVC
jgi:steroid 5-alpha reductase family enzyme